MICCRKQAPESAFWGATWNETGKKRQGRAGNEGMSRGDLPGLKFLLLGADLLNSVAHCFPLPNLVLAGVESRFLAEREGRDEGKRGEDCGT